MPRAASPSCPSCDTSDRMCVACVEHLHALADAKAKEVRAAIVAAQIAEAHRLSR